MEAIQRASGVGSEGRGQEEAPVDTRWQSEAKAVRVNRDCLKDLYVSAMEPSKYESAVLAAGHTFFEKSQASFDARLAAVCVCGCGVFT